MWLRQFLVAFRWLFLIHMNNRRPTTSAIRIERRRAAWSLQCRLDRVDRNLGASRPSYFTEVKSGIEQKLLDRRSKLAAAFFASLAARPILSIAIITSA
jgi:hypothetical protein